jgi:hypothetical protein
MNKWKQNPLSSDVIKGLAIAGATQSIFDCWFIGSYSSYTANYRKLFAGNGYFQGSGSPKIRAIAWIKNRFAENDTKIIINMYKKMYPYNEDFSKEPQPEELLAIHTLFNIKYDDTDKPLHINLVHSVLFIMFNRNNSEKTGLIFINCSCGREHVYCAYNIRTSCPCCRDNVRVQSSVPHIVSFEPDMDLFELEYNDKKALSI